MSDSKPRLLVVEDERHLAFMLQHNLEEEGYAVTVAADLAHAASQIAEPVDLVLLDVMLPDGSGFDFCRDLRRAGNHTPVLMLTARSAADSIVTGLDSGADDYLTKPFSLEELLGRVAALLRRRKWDQQASARTAPADILRIGGATVDFATHRATIGTRSVELTDLEVRLLRFLYLHEGRVVSREQLLQQVWEVSPHTHTRTVDAFIVRLRRLFEPDPSQPRHFLTVRGVGYRFVARP